MADLLMPLRLAWRLARGGDRAVTAWLVLTRPAGLMQPDGVTVADRNPRLLRAIQAHLPDRADLSLLSFGCSIGDEVFTLRRLYPTARITGIDISRARIARCRERLPAAEAARTRFVVANSAAGEGLACHDLVVANSVFRHHALDNGAVSSARILPFARVEPVMNRLAATVKPGGLFALRHANFRFEDMAAAAEFEPVIGLTRFAVKFGRDDRRLPDAPIEHCLFRRRAPAQG